MIVKYKSRGQWGWVSRIDDLTALGKTDPENIDLDDYGCSEVEYYGEPDGNEEPFVVSVTSSTGKPRVIAFYATEVYLTEDTSGSTIDILLQPRY